MVRFTLRLPQNVYNRLVMRAKSARRSVNRQAVYDLDMVERRGDAPQVVIVDMREGDVSADEISDVINRVTEAGW